MKARQKPLFEWGIGPIPGRELLPVLAVAAGFLLLPAGAAWLAARQYQEFAGRPVLEVRGTVTDALYGPNRSGVRLSYLELDHRAVRWRNEPGRKAASRRGSGSLIATAWAEVAPG